MAKAISSDVPLGLLMPDATLPDGNGQPFSLQQCYGPYGLLVMVISNHCPFVRHIAPFFAELSRRLGESGIGTVAISSSDIDQYPDDGPANMVNFSVEYGFDFPYLFDETQAVATALKATCTPDFYLFDAAGRLVYHGQLDESRPGETTPTDGRDLLQAAACLRAGKSIPAPQMPSLGCSIKPRRSSGQAVD